MPGTGRASTGGAAPGRPRGLASGLAALAAVSLAFSLAISYGTLHLGALGLATLATSGALAAAWLLPGEAPAPRRAAVLVPLGIGLALALAHDAAYLPGILVDPSMLGAFRPTLALVTLALSTHLWRKGPAWFAQARFAAVTLGAAALGGLVIRASPRPGIDVWHYQQEGALALLRGLDPYLLPYRNVYGSATTVIDSRLLSPDRQLVLANPYPPLSLLLDVPAAWLGDVRWTLLLAVVVAAVLIRRLGRGSLEADLAAAFLLLQPQAFFELEMAWTEPVALALVLATVLAVTRASGPAPGGAPTTARQGWVLPGLAAGLAISSKQYVAALLLPLLLTLDAKVRWRAAAVAAAVTAVIALPFLAAGPAAFYRGVVEFQLLQPFRADALSWPAQVAALGGPRLPTWPAFLLAVATWLITLRRAAWSTGRTLAPAQALLAGAGFWLVFVLFNKQAFCNYYWLAVGLLCASVATASGTPPESVDGGRPVQRGGSTRPSRKVSSGPSPQAQGR